MARLIMPHFFIRIFRASAVLGLLTACGDFEAQSPEIAESRAAIWNGKASTNSSVFALFGREYLCSATLIAPNLLLTARHCVATDEEIHDASTVSAANTEHVNAPQRDYHAARIRIPDKVPSVCGHDTALVILKTNIPESVAKPIVPRIDVPVTNGEILTVLGYGPYADDHGYGDRRELSGVKVINPVSLCGEVAASEFDVDKGMCAGDSGGPAIDKQGRVFGVASRYTPGCKMAIYETVSNWGAWFVEVGKEAAKLGKYEPPAWVRTGKSVNETAGSGGSVGAGGHAGSTSNAGSSSSGGGALGNGGVSGIGGFAGGADTSQGGSATAQGGAAQGGQGDDNVRVPDAAAQGGSPAAAAGKGSVSGTTPGVARAPNASSSDGSCNCKITSSTDAPLSAWWLMLGVFGFAAGRRSQCRLRQAPVVSTED